MTESVGRQSYHEVKITKDLRSKERTQDLIAFINEHITEYKGKTEGGHPIPVMLFAEKDHAHVFANQLSKKLNIPREHITVKAQR
jgi:2,3-bisphosphoglycerate-independent phosphoglycerate mutase